MKIFEFSGGFVRIFQPDFEFHFLESQFFSLSWHLIWLVCRAVPIFFYWQQRSRMDGPFRFFEHIRRTRRKFSGSLWKKVSVLKMSFWKIKLKIRSGYSDKISFFRLKLFFQIFLEIFLRILWTFSRYLKGPLNLELCGSKKIVTARHLPLTRMKVISFYT